MEGRSAVSLRREINQRLVIALLLAVLLWLRWGAHASPRRRWLMLTIAEWWCG